MAKVPVSIPVYAPDVNLIKAAADAALAAILPTGWTIEEQRLVGALTPVGARKANPGDPTPEITEWQAEVRANLASPE